MAFATTSLLNRYWRTYRRDDVHCRDLQVGLRRQILKNHIKFCAGSIPKIGSFVKIQQNSE